MENNETVIEDATLDESVDGDDDINFVDALSNLSKKVKANKAGREITVVEVQVKTITVCPCRFSSTNKSGSSRVAKR